MVAEVQITGLLQHCWNQLFFKNMPKLIGQHINSQFQLSLPKQI